MSKNTSKHPLHKRQCVVSARTKPIYEKILYRSRTSLLAQNFKLNKDAIALLEVYTAEIFNILGHEKLLKFFTDMNHTLKNIVRNRCHKPLLGAWLIEESNTLLLGPIFLSMHLSIFMTYCASESFQRHMFLKHGVYPARNDTAGTQEFNKSLFSDRVNMEFLEQDSQRSHKAKLRLD